MKRVIIESPFRGDTIRNLKYAQLSLKDSLSRGEAPFASHLLYTQVLDDKDLRERVLGMEAGWAWLPMADLVAVYEDYGISQGMSMGIEKARRFGILHEYRKILGGPRGPYAKI